MTLHLMILQIKDMDFVFIRRKPKILKQKRFMSQLKMRKRKVSSHLLIPFGVILHYRTSLRDSQTEKHPIY